MPRLSDPVLTKGRAIACLLNLYWNDADFKKELNSLRQPYLDILQKLARDLLGFWLAVKQALTPDEYKETMHHMYYEYALKRGKPPPLPDHLVQRLNENEKLWEKLDPYGAALEDFARKWKLRAPWAAFGLMWHDILQTMVEIFKLPKELDVPLDFFDDLDIGTPPLSPLEIRVSSWAFFHLTRQQMLQQIEKQLEDYEGEIRKSGSRERPSAIERHAKWWFEHYVHGKFYDEIAQEEAFTPGGLLASHAKNVGAAVRRFSRLIGIDPHAIK